MLVRFRKQWSARFLFGSEQQRSTRRPSLSDPQVSRFAFLRFLSLRSSDETRVHWSLTEGVVEEYLSLLCCSRVFISDVTKNSPAAVCGLRDGDRVVEINGANIQLTSYETVLSKVKQHMARDDLELLVLDKRALRWYQERNFPIGSHTLPTIVHMEPIINDLRDGTRVSTRYPQMNDSFGKVSMLLSPSRKEFI